MAYGTTVIRKFLIVWFCSHLYIKWFQRWRPLSLTFSLALLPPPQHQLCALYLQCWPLKQNFYYILSPPWEVTTCLCSPACLKALLSVPSDGSFLLAKCVLLSACDPESSFIIWRINRLLVKFSLSLPSWPPNIFTVCRNMVKCLLACLDCLYCGKMWLCQLAGKGWHPPQGHKQLWTVILKALKLLKTLNTFRKVSWKSRLIDELLFPYSTYIMQI